MGESHHIEEDFSRLELNLQAATENYRYFRSLLEPTTKLLVLVKANAYGHGAVEFAAMMQRAGADYLAVAYPVEGVELRYVMLCGEAMPVKSLNYWLRHMPKARIVNLYGPTEITCNCTYFEFEREYGDTELLPIGKAFKNSRVLLLDEEKKLISEKGRVGEICVGGSCLAFGYWNDPEKTSVATLGPTM